MKKFYFILVILLAFSGVEKAFSQFNVVFTAKDESDTITQVLYGGDINFWAQDPMYDDGTHGDTTAGDHVWSATYTLPTPGVDSTLSFGWGVYNSSGTWLVTGATLSATIDHSGTVTGNNYTIVDDPRSAAVVITYNDTTMSVGRVDINTSADGWQETPMYDDGTHGDSVAGDHIWSATINCMVRRSYMWNVFLDSTWTDIGGPVFTVSATGCVSGIYNYKGDNSQPTCYPVTGGSSAIKNTNLANISLYPNPVIDQLNISAGNVIRTVNVFNVFGQMVAAYHFNSSDARVDFTQLSKGIYFIKVTEASGNSFTNKVVKE